MRVVDRGIILRDADDLVSGLGHQARGHAAHVAEPLNHHTRIAGTHVEVAQRFIGDNQAASPGSLRPSLRAAQIQRFSGHYGRHGVALVHGIGIHDPGHGLLVRAHVGRRHVALRSDEFQNLGRVAPGDSLQLAFAQNLRIADHAALAAAKRDVHDGAFPRHPGRESAHFVERNIGSKTDAALGRAACNRMLNAISGEYFNPAVVQGDGDVDGQFHGGSAQHLPHAIIETEPAGRFIKTVRGGFPRIDFQVVDGRGRFQNHLVKKLLHSAIMTVKSGLHTLIRNCMNYREKRCVCRVRSTIESVPELNQVHSGCVCTQGDPNDSRRTKHAGRPGQ